MRTQIQHEGVEAGPQADGTGHSEDYPVEAEVEEGFGFVEGFEEGGEQEEQEEKKKDRPVPAGEVVQGGEFGKKEGEKGA